MHFGIEKIFFYANVSRNHRIPRFADTFIRIELTYVSVGYAKMIALGTNMILDQLVVQSHLGLQFL